MPQNVTRQRPCPICGKPDMCFFDVRQDGAKVIVCGRIRQDMVNGHDGKDYKMLPQKKSSSYTLYVDYADDLERFEEKRKLITDTVLSPGRALFRLPACPRWMKYGSMIRISYSRYPMKSLMPSYAPGWKRI